ncbi:MAG TPA: MoaD/ThiS family protein [Casimicrobiaceae bacterium]|nr:MoaD/ThiS family protein [Casimicrobiaceae bacterium]
MRDSTSTLVTLRLVYLARLREAFGSSGETLELAVHDSPSVASAVETLRARGGAFASELAPSRAVRFAVNHKVAHVDQPVCDGDEIAIFPPVTGG